jgi:hypothetical protein
MHVLTLNFDDPIFQEAFHVLKCHLVIEGALQYEMDIGVWLALSK